MVPKNYINQVNTKEAEAFSLKCNTYISTVGYIVFRLHDEKCYKRSFFLFSVFFFAF